MLQLPSPVYGPADPALGLVFTTRIPEPERLVYEYVEAGTQWSLTFGDDDLRYLQLPAAFRAPTVSYYPPTHPAYSSPDAPVIPVTRGNGLPYPGQIPAIGVFAGTDTEDEARKTMGGGFAGDVFAYNDDGTIAGTASYYSQPLYNPIVVHLIHENRDERDRLHAELHRLLFPLEHLLPLRDKQINSVKVDGEKNDLDMEQDGEPFTLYVSIFTVHCYSEILEARDITGPEGVIDSITITSPTLDPVTTDPSTLEAVSE